MGLVGYSVLISQWLSYTHSLTCVFPTNMHGNFDDSTIVNTHNLRESGIGTHQHYLTKMVHNFSKDSLFLNGVISSTNRVIYRHNNSYMPKTKRENE